MAAKRGLGYVALDRVSSIYHGPPTGGGYKGVSELIRRILNLGAVTAVAASLVTLSAQPSSATTLWTDTWGVGNYHAGPDHVPSAGSILAGTYCNASGAASYSYTSLVKTATQSTVFSMPSYPCDSLWHDSSKYSASTGGGVAYYMRWYGQNSSLSSGYSSNSAGSRAWR